MGYPRDVAILEKTDGTAELTSGASLDLSGSLKKNGSALVQGASFTIGSEAGDVINVAIQLEDNDGNDVDAAGGLMAYYSDDADGSSDHGSDANLSSAIGTDGLLMAVDTDGPFMLVSESDGDIDIDITKTDAGTIYLVLVLPDGSLAVSDAITFA